MNIKIIAIGNKIMQDDGIAIWVMEILKESYYKKGIEVIFGETDISYCLHKIEPEDFLIIIDATNFGIKPGTVTVINLDEFNHYHPYQINSLHDLNLPVVLQMYNFSLRGFIIGIEISKIDFANYLTSELSCQLNNISNKVENQINKILSLSFRGI